MSTGQLGEVPAARSARGSELALLASNHRAPGPSAAKDLLSPAHHCLLANRHQHLACPSQPRGLGSKPTVKREQDTVYSLYRHLSFGPTVCRVHKRLPVV